MRFLLKLKIATGSILITTLFITTLQTQAPRSYSDGKYTLQWDSKTDKAAFETSADHAQIWTGSPLPGFRKQTIADDTRK